MIVSNPRLRQSLAATIVLWISAVASSVAPAQSLAADPLDVWNLQSEEGAFNFFWDEADGRVYLELSKFDEPFLYVSSLATGLGSNPIGLDRGQLGDNRVVYWKRVGGKAYMIQSNWKFRASTTSAAEQKAVRDSFAESILWSEEIKSTTAGTSVIDLTEFLLRDAHDCISTLASNGQGTFTLDRDRSFVYRPRTKAFPQNSEFEAALTFRSSKPGRLANRTAADGSAITLRQHHSFVKLPDDGYRPRRFDPRAGCFHITYSDYGMPIDQPLEQRWITRHRLKKRVPGPAASEPVEPIVYYVDPGVPQPVRDALIEGASWWSQAFATAGFLNAFQVRVLPPDADPMDVRYNVIQWVHRATRGWSYGQSVVDPRTGEIIKGNVLLGSLRVRQDQLLMDGLLHAPQKNANAAACGLGMVPDESYLTQLAPGYSTTDVALARIRQLSAHEVGHTLGFAHNFAASTYADRASVMDYPAPKVTIVDGQLDLADAYAEGIGTWDKFTVQYAYSEFPSDTEQQQLNQLVSEAIEQGMRYITDADARPDGAAHPLGNLWDNGADPLAGLAHEMQVRRIAISKFDASVLTEAQPLAELEKAFVPIYLHHRYSVDAAAKMLGGVDYSYAVKGDGQSPLQPVPIDRQQAALDELLKTLSEDALVIPDSILQLLPPRVFQSVSDDERFASTTAPMFDATSAIRAAADLTLANLLQPQRASRLASIESTDWGLSTVIQSTIDRTFRSPKPATAKGLEARRIVQQVFVERLIDLAEDNSTSSDARALAAAHLASLVSTLRKEFEQIPMDTIDTAHFAALVRHISRFLGRPHPQAQKTPAVEIPPGSPIGTRP